MNQSKNLIMKSLALTLVLFIIVIPSLPSHHYKKVHAQSFAEQTASLTVIAMILTTLATQGIVSNNYSISNSDLTAIRSKINEGGENLINGVNTLGTAIKNGADKATIQALATGATIYGMMQAMQNVLFPVNNANGTVGNFYGSCNGYDIYVYTSHFNNTEKFFISSIGYWPNTSTTKCIYVGSIDTNSTFKTGSYTRFYLKNKITGEVVQHAYTAFSDLTFRVIDSGTESIIYNMLTGGTSLYYPDATNLQNKESIYLPTTLPQTIINNITNYDGISDLVLGIPEGYTIPVDNSITVNPSTIVDNPPIDEPVDPPVEEPTTLLGTVAAILAGILPISGILDDIKIGIDGIATTITGTITDIMTATNDILTDIATFPTTFSDYMTFPTDLIIPMGTLLPSKLPIIDQIKGGFELMLSGGERPLIIRYPFNGEIKEINLNWYEPMRLQVKAAIGVIFQILLTLAVINMVSSVFGMPNIGRTTGGAIAQDRDYNNSPWRS